MEEEQGQNQGTYMEEEPPVYPVNEKLMEDINNYTKKINIFKKDLYNSIVKKDTSHNSNSLGPVYDYHGSLMQLLGFWISILDHYNLQMPAIHDPELQQSAVEITQITQKFRQESVDSRIQAYNVLLKKSTEHPYFFINDS